MISTDISGRVVEVAVRDNQRVDEGPGAVPARRPAVPHRGRGGEGAARRGAAADRGAEGDLSPEAGRRQGRRRTRSPISSANSSGRRQLAASGVAARVNLRPGRRTRCRWRARRSPRRRATSPICLAQLGGNADLPLDQHPIGAARPGGARPGRARPVLHDGPGAGARHRHQGRAAAGRQSTSPPRPRCFR